MKNINTYIMVGVTAVVVGAGGFVAGTKYQQSQTQRRFTQGNSEVRGNLPSRGANVGGSGRGMTVGEVSAKENNNLTLKMADGSSKIVILADSTTYQTCAEAKLENIEVGSKVAVNGATGNDGTITANNIEINPVQWPTTNK